MATIRLPPDFREFLQLLNENQVEYLLVGGYAVGYYGYPRAMVDMDIWIGWSPETALPSGPRGRENIAQGRGRRPTPWVLGVRSTPRPEGPREVFSSRFRSW